MRMAYEKGVHDKARKVHGLTVGAEGEAGIEKNRCLSG
jgi:hypothetical protein